MTAWKYYTRLKNLLCNIASMVKSKFQKRDNKIILFGAWFGQSFSDTPRCLFQYLSENKNRYELKHVVWVTRNPKVWAELLEMGYECYMMYSDESKYYHKRAGIHIICNSAWSGDTVKGDILGEYSFGAKKVNLWHGVCPVKKVGRLSNDFQNQSKTLYRMIRDKMQSSQFFRALTYGKGGWGDAYYLTTTKRGTEVMQGMLGIVRERCIETGNPRACGYLKLMKGEKKIIDEIGKHSAAILYLPTFRKNDNEFDYEHLSEVMYRKYRNDDILFLQKLHNASKGKLDKRCRDRICNISDDIDITTVIPYVDIVVTDYSSVLADAVFFDKKLIFYIPDLQSYADKDVGLIDEYYDIIDGISARDDKEFLQIVKRQMEDDYQVPIEKYEKIKKCYWGNIKEYDVIWHDIMNAIS